MLTRLLPLFALACGSTPADRTPEQSDTDPPIVDTDQADSDNDGAPPTETGTPSSPTRTDGAWDGCRGWDDCPEKRVCDIALGRCEIRTVWTQDTPALFSFHPPAVAPGDLLVVDGARFWVNVLQLGQLQVEIGGSPAPLFPGPDPDHTRLLVTAPEGATGVVRVVNDRDEVVVSSDSLAEAEPGVLPCDGSTPTASLSGGDTVDDAGPWSAGYLDLADLAVRVFYPAHCGSLRREAVSGTWPLVGLLHGNGAGFVNYEYLGQLLATWGFVVAMPYSDIDNGGGDPVVITPAQTNNLVAVFGVLRGADLTALHPALAGVATTSEVGFVGHSRGTARMQALIGADADVEANTVAAVFLGPVDDGDQVPGLFLLVVGGKDRQSTPLMSNAAYNRQPPPKWKVQIPGGNHGLFSDHKVWTGFLDGVPEISRLEQLRTVSAFTLPLMMRAHGLGEPFAAQLDDPPASPLYTVTSE